ncbi:MAG: tyrosine-type recombinase/integrase [Acidobacteriales bacterium]|nr:tyrosine-type recombinase/integrase [Terriglobales bacterium]
MITIEHAVTKFLASKKKQNLNESTLGKLDTIFEKQLLTWAKTISLQYLADVTLPHLEDFRETWKDGPLARKKKQERVIGFFYYCLRLGWITKNPAALLGRIKADDPPTDYFPKEDFNSIIDATYIYQPKGWSECRHQSTRLRILTLLMRWSGLAIRDAITLERRRLNDRNELLLSRAKTGHPVYVPLPEHVAEALRTIPPGPKPNPRYFFWSGNGSPKSAVGNWQRSYRRLFKLVDLKREDGSPKRCHPHMFRDTFAVEMLLAGVPLEQVAMLLGHKSVKITEKHYAPWVKARQEQLATSVRKAWEVIEPTLIQQPRKRVRSA